MEEFLATEDIENIERLLVKVRNNSEIQDLNFSLSTLSFSLSFFRALHVLCG